MFLTLDVVNKVNTVVKDSHNRTVAGFKAVVEKEILNLHNLSYVREIPIEERFPKHEMFGPSDVTDIDGKNLCLLTFNFGNVSSEKVVLSSFSDLMQILGSRVLTK
jgi:hypothetical protein